MLDDLKYIHEKDAEDALGIAERQIAQLTHQFDLGNAGFGKVSNVVYAAMGGSALAALLLRSWPGLGTPFEVVREYDIPKYVGAETLFIAASYSGNTEETLSALEHAETQGAQIAVITSGGKLLEIAKAKNYPFVILPKAEQPRYAVFYNFRALLAILEKAGLLAMAEIDTALAKAAEFLQQNIAAWLPTVPTANNPAKQLAQELMGKSIVVYGGPKMFAAAYKWKISFNENAKHIAWTDEIPEFNHNEFIGWSEQPRDKPYAVIDLRSTLEHPRVQKRFEVTERLLSGLRPAPHVVQAMGETLPEHLLWTIMFGDFVSLYLALLSGLDPAPVVLVEKFKKVLSE